MGLFLRAQSDSQGEAMNNDKILDTIDQYLDQHVNGIRGHLRQEPYISDFFSLFAASYLNRDSGSQITGDGLVKAIGERIRVNDDSERHSKKVELLRRLSAMWDEWDYAWEKYPRHGLRNND